MALIRSGATKASTMSAEPRHCHLSIRGLHISHCRARELMASTSRMEPFFEILTSGPLTLLLPPIHYDSDLDARQRRTGGSPPPENPRFPTPNSSSQASHPPTPT